MGSASSRRTVREEKTLAELVAQQGDLPYYPALYEYSHGTIRYRGEQEAADRRKRGSISLVAGKSGYYYHRNRPDNDADFVTNNEGDALIKNNVHMLEVSRNPNSGLNDVFFVCPPGQSNKVRGNGSSAFNAELAAEAEMSVLHPRNMPMSAMNVIKKKKEPFVLQPPKQFWVIFPDEQPPDDEYPLPVRMLQFRMNRGDTVEDVKNRISGHFVPLKLFPPRISLRRGDGYLRAKEETALAESGASPRRRSSLRRGSVSFEEEVSVTLQDHELLANCQYGVGTEVTELESFVINVVMLTDTNRQLPVDFTLEVLAKAPDGKGKASMQGLDENGEVLYEITSRTSGRDLRLMIGDSLGQRSAFRQGTLSEKVEPSGLMLRFTRGVDDVLQDDDQVLVDRSRAWIKCSHVPLPAGSTCPEMKTPPPPSAADIAAAAEAKAAEEEAAAAAVAAAAEAEAEASESRRKVDTLNASAKVDTGLHRRRPPQSESSKKDTSEKVPTPPVAQRDADAKRRDIDGNPEEMTAFPLPITSEK